MRKNIKVLVILCSCVIVLYGCAAMTNKDKQMESSTLLEPQSILKFGDVPVPVGFKLLPRLSYTFESSGVRVGVLRYRGKATPGQVVNFYKEQMPLYNWNLLNVIEYGELLMNFEREQETCIIGLSPKRNTVTITASLGPKPQIPRKSNKPVK